MKGEYHIMKHARNLGRALSLLLVLTMLVGVVASMAVTGSAAVALPSGATAWDGTTISTSLEGSGTEEDPYLIANAEDFVYFYNNTSEEDTFVYQLTGDVYFAKNNPKTAPSFGGTLDGNGHTIWNFDRSAWGGAVVVFTKVSGAIKNITFEGLNLSTGENGDSALMTTLSGTLSNVHVKNATYKGGHVAGLSKNISGTTSTEITVENCSVQGTMKSVGGNSAYVGGVFARVDGPTAGLNILGCTIDVTVTSDGGAVRFGGLAAGVGAEYSANKVAKLTIADCVVRGSYKDTVGGASQYLGGLVGHVGQYCTTMAEINNCIVDMDIESANVESAGGLIGQSYRSIYLNNCMSSGDVTITAPVDNNYIGGVVGRMEQENDCKIILNNYAQYGNVTGGKNVGGIVGIIRMGYYSGKNNSPITLSGVILAGDVSGTAYVGGIAGYATSGSSTTSRYLDIELFSSAMTGTVSVAAGGRAGLFIGGSIDATPTNKITADGKSYVNESLTVFAPGNTTEGVVADKVSTDYSTYTPATYSASVLTDGTVLGVVNTYALANAKMPWVQGETAPELLVTALKLHGANLELTGNLTMNMRMDASVLPVNANVTSVKLVAGDKAYEGVQEGKYYVFAVDDIAAADMGEDRDYYIAVQITTGDTTKEYKSLTPKAYSPVTYAKNIVAREDEEAVKAHDLLDALVTYAYWAEVLRDGTSGVIDNYNAVTGRTLSADSITYISLARGDVSAAALNSYVTVGANLNTGVNLVFKVKDSADVASLTLTAGGGTKTYYATEGYIEITDVHAGMLKNKLEITLNNAAGDAIASGTYSVANYLEGVSKADLATHTWQEQFAARAAAMYMLAVGQYQTPAYYEVEGLESKTYNVADYQEVTNSYIFEENQFAEDQTTASLDGVEWTVDGANAYDYDADLGQAFGADESVVLSTDHYAQVNTVKVTASTAGVATFARRSVGATLEVYVGGTQIGETITLTDVATEYEFVVPAGVSGTLEIRAAATALYIKAIEVNGIKGEGAPAPEVHEHNYVVSSVTAPTCTEVGYTTYICDCGETYTDDEVPALGHTWADATCTTPKTCTECGETEGEALGHTAGEAVKENETLGGYDLVVYCSVCGVELERTPVVAPTGNAKIGDNYYATLADALAAAVAGDTVELLANETYASILMIDKAITLEGNGKTLTSTAGRAINIETAETVTINNLTIACGNGCERGINIINVAGTTNLNNVTVENASQYAVHVATSAGAVIVNIDGCDLTGKNVVNVAGAGAVVTVANTNLVVDDQTEAEAYAALALYITAEGATITATNCTFDIKGDSSKAYNGTADGSIIIAGSEDEVENAIAYIEYPGQVAYLFPTLQDAIDFAKDGETVVLVRDVVLTETVTISKNVTIDLNGKTISGDFDSSYGIIYVKRGATLTINGEGAIYAQASTAIGTYGTVIVNGGNVISDAAPYCGAIYNFYYNESYYGTTVINGGSVDSILNCGNLTVNGGEVAYIDNSGKLVVVGGTVTKILAQDGSDAADVAGAGTIEIADIDGIAITLPDGYELVEIEAGVYQVLLAHTHNYELTETVDATCTVDGSKTFTCACGDSYTETIEATGHTEETVAGKDATCTEAGLTEGKKCSVCGEILVAQEEIAATGHTPVVDEAVAPDCDDTGLTEGSHCSVCGETIVAQDTIDALGHTEEIVAGKDATCTETGLTEGKVCTVCGVTTVEQVVIPVSHNFVDGECSACGWVEASEPTTVTVDFGAYGAEQGWTNQTKYTTFTVDGVTFTASSGTNTGKFYTSGTGTWRIYSSENGTITIKAPASITSIKVTWSEGGMKCNGVALTSGTAMAVSGDTIVITATAKTFITDIEVVYGKSVEGHFHNYVGATCAQLGACEVCGKQGGELLPHNEVAVDAVAPTCTETGLTAGSKCSVCGEVLTAQEEIVATGHTEVVDEAVAPTCTATGLTAGSHCSVCEEVLVAQEVVDMIDHNWVDPTCEEDGYCSGCQAKGDPATGVHNYVDGFCDMCGKEEPACQHENTTVLEAVAPTCTEDGLTEGTKCSACGEILVAQEVVDALGHTEVADEAVAPTCTATGLTAGSHCSVCNEVFVAQEEVATLPHTYVGANCQTEGVCSVCGAIGEKDATIHEDLTAATCTTAQTCVCGETVGEPAPHNYGDDGFCTYDCGAKQILTEKTYDYTVTAKQWSANGDKTLNGIVWTLAGDGNYWGYDGTKGQQFGSGSYPYKNLTLTSGTLANVTKIVINTSTASSATATLKVYVGGTQIGAIKTLTSSATSYTFESATPLSGEVKLVYTQTTSKALYLKSINISYADVKVLGAHEHTFEGATCTTSGTCTYTENGLVCGKQGGEALGHTVVVDEAVAATCTTTGLTEGSHCDLCGEVLVAQQETDALGHDFENGENGMCANGCGTASCEHTEKVAIGEAKEPTCTEAGITAGEKCANCGQIFVEQEEIAATGHTIVVDEAVAATCVDTGLTEGSHCSVCEAVLVAQTEVPATGEHTFVDGTCSVCNYVKPSSVTTTVNTYATEGTMSGTTSISWTSGDVTVTNNKANSSTAIRTSDSDHYRTYVGSQVVVSTNSGQKITKIVITCSSSSYVANLVSDINAVDGCTATVSGSVVTVVVEGDLTEVAFSITKQARITKVAVTHEG